VKRKCQICHGKGGYYVGTPPWERFVSCFQCKGKGRWYDTKRPRAKKAKR
jgi:DnaJ-class molecular chaperone